MLIYILNNLSLYVDKTNPKVIITFKIINLAGLINLLIIINEFEMIKKRKLKGTTHLLIFYIKKFVVYFFFFSLLLFYVCVSSFFV